MGLRRLRLLVLVAAISPSAALPGCEDILPVETIHRCEGDDPPDDCTCADNGAQLDEDIGTRAAICPECQGSSPHGDCENAVDSGTSATDAADAGSGASGSSATDGGDGGGGVCTSCPDAQPKCFEGNECVECLAHGDCGGMEDRCEPEAHACVQCLGDADCAGNTPKCDLEAHACVECLSSSECGAAEPVCGEDHRCQDCTDNAACEGRTGTERCDTRAASATLGECVECLGHGHCANPTPQCTNGACVPCTGDGACATRIGAEVCNTLEGAQTVGQCVECTGATEEAQCVDKACKQSTGECTEVERGTLTPCSSCQADSECVTGAKCVPHPFDGSTLGPRCFFERATNSGCADTVAAVRPYSQAMTLQSIDAIETLYCLPITTCKAAEDATGANPRTCISADGCGEVGVPDGYCIEPGHPTASGKCSYHCAQSYDCPAALGFTSCDGPLAGKFCQPP